MEVRTEFGHERTKCACTNCQTNCRFMPGFLIPADLKRMIPAEADPFKWAEENLLASPGALVMAGGEIFRIPTLVPAVKADGSCIHLSAEGRCGIHAVAPFGCAFFDCKSDGGKLGEKGLLAVYGVSAGSLYQRLWNHLFSVGKRQHGPEILRARMREALHD